MTNSELDYNAAVYLTQPDDYRSRVSFVDFLQARYSELSIAEFRKQQLITLGESEDAL